MLAYVAGRLIVEEGGLETSEGRLVATRTKGGSIRVKDGLGAGRRRFTIAHEIGHFILHPLEEQDRQHSPRDFAIFHDAGEEAEANIFAAELLTPEFLFKPRSRGRVSSLAWPKNSAPARWRRPFNTFTIPMNRWHSWSVIGREFFGPKRSKTFGHAFKPKEFIHIQPWARYFPERSGTRTKWFGHLRTLGLIISVMIPREIMEDTRTSNTTINSSRCYG